MTIAPSTATAPLRVVATGGFPVDVPLCEELSHRRDVELVGLAADVTDAAPAFASDHDAVLLWADDIARARADLSEIRKHTGAPAILVAPSVTPALIEAAGRMEVADVVVASQPSESVAFAITKAAQFKPSLPQASAPSRGSSKGRIITVFSPKGGTGKTALSTNLAVALAHHQGLKTLLVDLDLQFGDAALTLGLEPSKTIYDLTALPGAIEPDKLRGYTTPHPSGLSLLAAPVRPEEADAIDEEKVAEILETARDTYEVTVVDTSPFFYGAMLAALEPTDQLMLLCSLDVPTLKNVRLSVQTLELLGFPSERINLVMNRFNPAIGITIDEVEVVLGRKIAFQLPDDPAVPLAINRGNPAVLSDSGSAFGQAALAMAGAVAPVSNSRARATAHGVDISTNDDGGPRPWHRWFGGRG